MSPSPIQKASIETATRACSISWPIWLISKDITNDAFQINWLAPSKIGYFGREDDLERLVLNLVELKYFQKRSPELECALLL